MKVYRGTVTPEGTVVTVNGKVLDPRLDIRNHSPSGLSWGYGGSGPSQLALAILADLVGVEEALRHYQEFKWSVIAKFVQDADWILTEEYIRASLKVIA